MRRPRGLVLRPHDCHWKGSRQGIAYGSVWVDVLATGAVHKAALRPDLLRNARKLIADHISKAGLTFARWAPITNHWDLVNLGYVWHVCAEVVWDDAYEAVQTGP